MTRFFISDLHLGHKNVLSYEDRPFKSLEEMHAALIANWNKVVGPEDTVYILGDFATWPKDVIFFGKALNGKKKLVPGNHDLAFKFGHKAPAKQDVIAGVYQEGGIEILSDLEPLVLKNGVSVLMCHFPWRVEGASQKYQGRRPERESGRWLLHGHVHSLYKVKEDLCVINCSVENWNYSPIPEDEIVRIINGG